MNNFQFHFPTQLRIGEGERKQLGKIAAEYGKKAFLAFDPFLNGSTVQKEMLEDLSQNGVAYEIFSDIVPNPRNTSIDQGAELCRNTGCELVIAVGGGSAIDTAKAIALTAALGGSCWDYTERQGEYVKRPDRPGLPLIAIPTTAGTGTEATQFAVINNPEQVRKCTIITPLIYPCVSLIDPELMQSIPGQLTALTGIDTFAHAFEAYICKGHNEFSDALALHAMELFAKSIRTAVHDGSNLEARGMMAMSCTLAGAAFSHAGVCLPHAMGQPLSAFTDAPHGGTLAACIPQVIEWTIPYAEERLARVAEILDADAVAGKTQAEKAAALPEIIGQLYDDLNVHVSFSGYGLKEDDLDAFVDLCFTAYKQDMDQHPKPVTRQDVYDLVRKCMNTEEG
ncbi:MAG: iron-containing alcohol dehydrogenase [Clostridia bacterium]|nr:iron-containing alcohol dehydrogenase [Clostridia bacterium]